MKLNQPESRQSMQSYKAFCKHDRALSANGMFRQLSCVAKGLIGGRGAVYTVCHHILACSRLYWGGGGVSVDRTLILHLQYHTMHIYILRYTGSIKCVSFTHQSWNDRHLFTGNTTVYI